VNVVLLAGSFNDRIVADMQQQRTRNCATKDSSATMLRGTVRCERITHSSLPSSTR